MKPEDREVAETEEVVREEAETEETPREEARISGAARVERTTRLSRESVLLRVRVLADRLLRFRLLVQCCRPFVLVVKIYPVDTNDPSGLYDVVFRI